MNTALDIVVIAFVSLAFGAFTGFLIQRRTSHDRKRLEAIRAYKDSL